MVGRRRRFGAVVNDLNQQQADRPQTTADIPVGTILRHIRVNYHIVKIAENTWAQFFSGGGLCPETYSDPWTVFDNYEVVTFDEA